MCPSVETLTATAESRRKCRTGQLEEGNAGLTAAGGWRPGEKMTSLFLCGRGLIPTISFAIWHILCKSAQLLSDYLHLMDMCSQQNKKTSSSTNKTHISMTRQHVMFSDSLEEWVVIFKLLKRRCWKLLNPSTSSSFCSSDQPITANTVSRSIYVQAAEDKTGNSRNRRWW